MTSQFLGKIDNQGGLEESRGMRAAILSASFLPFLYYGTKDTLFHFRGRKVSRTEHWLHAGVGLALVIMFSHALMGHHAIMLGALLLFVLVGALDEYIYHRDIPAEESDLHAKEHLALLIFVVMALVTDWLEKHHWNLVEALTRLRETTGGAL
jgi:hypothetical protein